MHKNTGRAACLTALMVTTLSLSATPARADVIVHRDFIARLSENNIRAFLENVEQIVNGNKPGMTPAKMNDYFQDHMAENGTFATILHYDVSGTPAKDINVSLTKQQYIDGVMKGNSPIKDYNSTIDILNLNIAADGKSATLKTVTREQGKLMPGQQAGQAEQVVLPVTGESTCDETVILSASNLIQLQSANCTTSMKVGTDGAAAAR